MRRIGLIVALAGCVALIAGPAHANPRDTAGDQLELLLPCFDGQEEIEDQPANTPFHIRHGHLLEPGVDTAIGRHRFELWVDDEKLRGQLIWEQIEGRVFLSHLYNFPDGLEGTHTIRFQMINPQHEFGCMWDIDFTS